MPITPVSGDLAVSPVGVPDAYSSHFSHGREEAHPGYYRVFLDDTRADVRLATSERAGYGRFAFEGAGRGRCSSVPPRPATSSRARRLRSTPAARKLTGWLKSGGFCDWDPKENPYTLYFAVEFRQAIHAHGFWQGEVRRAGVDSLSGDNIASLRDLWHGRTRPGRYEDRALLR